MENHYHLEARRKQRVLERKNQALQRLGDKTFLPQQGGAMHMKQKCMSTTDLPGATTGSQRMQEAEMYANTRTGPFVHSFGFRNFKYEDRTYCNPRCKTDAPHVDHPYRFRRMKVNDQDYYRLRCQTPKPSTQNYKTHRNNSDHLNDGVNPTRPRPKSSKTPRDSLFEIVHPYEFLHYTDENKRPLLYDNPSRPSSGFATYFHIWK